MLCNSGHRRCRPRTRWVEKVDDQCCRRVHLSDPVYKLIGNQWFHWYGECHMMPFYASWKEASNDSSHFLRYPLCSVSVSFNPVSKTEGLLKRKLLQCTAYGIQSLLNQCVESSFRFFTFWTLPSQWLVLLSSKTAYISRIELFLEVVYIYNLYI